MMRTRIALFLLAAVAGGLLASVPARADDFYRGKNLNIVVGSTPSACPIAW